MEQLRLKDIIKIIGTLQNKGMTMDKIMELPIYLGNDDELNGVHTSWFVQLIDKNNKEDKDFVDLINEDYHNRKLENKGILIS